jgi:4'-phosphopantetheinyl transferase EntD
MWENLCKTCINTTIGDDTFEVKQINLATYKTFRSGKSAIAIWKIEEEVSDFDMAHLVNGTKTEKQGVQWLSSRKALNVLGVHASEVIKDEFGKPHMASGNEHISISHCDKYAAAIRGNAVVGIDIEEITPRIERIAKRILHPTELDIVDRNERLITLYVLWSAKEALYKLYGKKAVDFREHMRALPFELKQSGQFTMEFLKYEEISSFDMNYEVFDNHTLVWVEG